MLSLISLDPPRAADSIGSLGAYDVLEHVATGGMGVVLKARDTNLGRIVALKFLSPFLASRAVARARFLREARAAAAVVHEHVVPIHAVDEWKGLPYLVMQFISGKTLAQRLELGGPLQLAEILRIGAQITSGLAAAHAQGLIHRDIKPGNILLENSVERVKITDFGLARTINEVGMTRTGDLAGTPEYMSPEHAAGKVLTASADLFSFGAVLYAMATGSSPFRAESCIGAIRNVCDLHPPPLNEVAPALPSWLSDLTEQLLAKDPAERPSSAAEISQTLFDALSRLQSAVPLESRTLTRGADSPSKPRRRSKSSPGPAHRRGRFPFSSAWFKYGSVVAAGALATALLITLLPDAGPFALRSSDGRVRASYPNLSAALNGALSGETIEIRANHVRIEAPLQVQGKVLHIRGAEGFHPELRYGNLNSSVLVTDSDLQLTGLRFLPRAIPPGFSLNAREAPPALDSHQSIRPRNSRDRDRDRTPRDLGMIIDTSAGSLVVSNCAFMTFADPGGTPDQRSGCIRAIGAREVTITGSFFASYNSASLEVASGRGAEGVTIRIEGSAFIGRNAFHLAAGAPAPTRLHLLGNTFVTQNLLHVASVTGGMTFITVISNTISSRACLVLRTEARPSAPEIKKNAIEWKGRDNTYSHVEAFLRAVRPPASGAGSDGPIRESIVGTFSEWISFWDNRETGSHFSSLRFPLLTSSASLDKLGASDLVPKAD